MRELFVWKKERLVGRLIADDGSPQSYTFVYESDVAPGDFVSLTMPTGQKVYGPRVTLHPIFDMNLPEAERRAAYFREAARYGGADELTLLARTGQRQIGALRFSDSPKLVTSPVRPLDLTRLQKVENGQQLFEEIFEELAYSSGVSGVEPKVLAPTETSATGHPADTDTAGDSQRLGTLVADTHILKTDRALYEGMVVSEYLCGLALKAAGLAVPKCWLSDDGRLLVIERFDRADGVEFHFEEVCSLMGLNAGDKYNSTYERVAECLGLFLAPQSAYAGLRDFYKALLVHRIVGNADAHLKNFAVLCTHFDDVHLAPIYDTVSTRAFLNTPPGVLLAGAARWWDGKTLHRFALSACQLSPKDAKAALDEACNGAERALGPVEKLGARLHFFAETAAKMHAIWTSGIRDLRAGKNGPPPEVKYPKRSRPRQRAIGASPAFR